MKIETIEDYVTSKKRLKFAEKIIEQVHANPEIKRIMEINETVAQTKHRVLKDTKYGKKFPPC